MILWWTKGKALQVTRDNIDDFDVGSNDDLNNFTTFTILIGFSNFSCAFVSEKHRYW